MNVFCPNCGSQNEAGVKFCWKCGTSLAGLPASDAKPTDAAATSTPPTTPEPAAPPPAATEPVTPVPPAAAEPVVPPPPLTPVAPVVPPPAAAEPVIAPPPAPVAPVAPPLAAQPMSPPPPLAPAATPPPPPVYAAAAAAPAPGGGGPKSRIPMPVMIGGVVAALVVAAGVGIVLAGGNNNGPTPSTQSLPTPGPTRSAVATTAPTPGPIVSLAPVPTGSVVNPTPVVVTPTPGTTTGGQTISVEAVAITVPSDWEVLDQGQTYISLFVPAGGQLWIESWNPDPAATAAQLLQAEVDRLKAKYPDVTVCIEEGDYVFVNGPPGRKVGLCYTAQSSSGEAYKTVDFFAYGASDGGTIAYYINVYAGPAEWDAVVKEVVLVFPNIQWKLYSGG